MKTETILALVTITARVVLAIVRELSGYGTLKRRAARRKAANAPADTAGDTPEVR